MGLQETVIAAVRQNEALSGVVVLSLSFGESFLPTAVFLPSSPIFIAVSGIEAAAGGPLLPLVLAVVIGAAAGDLVSFAIGYRYRNDLHKLWLLEKYPDVIQRCRHFFDRWGILAVLGSKLSGPFRPVVPMLAGAAEMHLPTFLAASAVSSLMWSVLVMAPAYYGLKALAG